MRVALVSTHRSDRAHYAPLRRLLEADERFVVDVTNSGHIQGAGKFKADAAVVLGDRIEMLQAAILYVEARIPLLHIHGGEHTYGSLDERWRWAMSAISDVHCVATNEAGSHLQDALAACGVRETRIVVTGAPGLDDIHDRKPFPNAPKIVVLYNPAIDEETTRREARAIRDAMTGLGVYIWIAPNGDRFSDTLIREFGGPTPRPGEMEPEKFRDLLAAAHVIVGNSSAGIIEAPSLGTWTVNVGERQAGRPRASGIYDVGKDAVTLPTGQPDFAGAIRWAIEDALKRPKSVAANPYGDGHASERIRDVLIGMGGK